MLLVLLLKATQNRNGVFNRRLGDKYGLETTCKSSVLLDVLAVFIQRSGANCAKLATSKCWLQDVTSIHGSLGSTSAYDGVKLVDEEDNLAVRLGHLFYHALQAVLKLTTVLCACYQGRHVKLNKLFVTQGAWNVARNNALCQAFHNCGLTNTRFADKNRIVLGAAAQNLNGTANLFDATNNWIKLSLASKVGHVATVLLQGFKLRLCILRGYAFITPKLVVDLLHALSSNAGVAKNPTCISVIVCQRSEQMLGGNVGISQLSGKLLGLVDNLEKVVANANLCSAYLWSLRDRLVYLRGNCIRICANLLQDRTQVALIAVQQRLEQVRWCNLGSLYVVSNTKSCLQCFLGGYGPFI